MEEKKYAGHVDVVVIDHLTINDGAERLDSRERNGQVKVLFY